MAEGARFRIVDGELDAGAALDAVRDPACGAVASFVGTVRGENDGREVLRLEYEVHESMALRQFERLDEDLRTRFGVARLAVHHRRGVVPVGGVSVTLAVSAARRGPTARPPSTNNSSAFSGAAKPPRGAPLPWTTPTTCNWRSTPAARPSNA